jgi:hypothetical protein
MGEVHIAGFWVWRRGSCGAAGDFCMMLTVVMLALGAKRNEDEAFARSQMVSLTLFSCSASPHTCSLSEALLLFNEEVKTPHNKGEYRNPN